MRIEEMVSNMVEEGELRVTLDSSVESIFKTQLVDAFCYHRDGPEGYWRDLETEWRNRTSDPIPTKYRTNKSVILKAWKYDGSLAAWCLGGLGAEFKGYMGKSAIQNEFSNGAKLTKEGGLARIIRIIDKVRADSGEEEKQRLYSELAHHIALNVTFGEEEEI